jgi:hypothetical protein
LLQVSGTPSGDNRLTLTRASANLIDRLTVIAPVRFSVAGTV